MNTLNAATSVSIGTPPWAGKSVSAASERTSGIDRFSPSEAQPGPAAPRRPTVGPLPDFSPLAGVAVHTMVSDLCGSLVGELTRILGARVQVSGVGYRGPRDSASPDTSLVWMRDYTPMRIATREGQPRLLKFLSVNPTRSGYTGSTWIPMVGPSPRHEFYRPPGQTTGGQWLETCRVPLLHGDGNQVSSGRHVFVTEKLIEENFVTRNEAHLREGGYKPRSRDETVAVLAESSDCAKEDIVVLPRMPGEKTGDIDTYLMALDERTLVIPQIRAEAFSVIGYPHEHALGREVQAFLDERAAQLESLDYKVLRPPMLAPVYLTPAHEEGKWHGVFYSPTNGVLLDHGQKDLLVPSFDAEGFPDAYKALNERYRNEWTDLFKHAGWTPTIVDASRVGRAYGLLRCVTEVVPDMNHYLP